jgi:hypothetical protein
MLFVINSKEIDINIKRYGAFSLKLYDTVYKFTSFVVVIGEQKAYQLNIGIDLDKANIKIYDNANELFDSSLKEDMDRLAVARMLQHDINDDNAFIVDNDDCMIAYNKKWSDIGILKYVDKVDDNNSKKMIIKISKK